MFGVSSSVSFSSNHLSEKSNLLENSFLECHSLILHISMTDVFPYVLIIFEAFVVLAILTKVESVLLIVLRTDLGLPIFSIFPLYLFPSECL